MQYAALLSCRYCSLCMCCFASVSWLIDDDDDDIFCPRGSDGGQRFSSALFYPCDQDNSWTAALSSMKFCTDRSKVKVTGPDYRISFHRFEISQKLLDTIIHEPLHSAWRHSACACASATSGTLLNLKVIGQRSRSHGVSVFFSTATCGQYLALRKAW